MQVTEHMTHHTPNGFSDRFALAFTKFLRFFADTFFAKRYGHRAIILETVAAIPGMVGGTLQHLKSLRRIQSDAGWIKTLLDEAENERMHLLTFIQIAQPSWFERWVILLAQGLFYNLFFMIYLISPHTELSVILRKKPYSVTRCIWQKLTKGPSKTSRPQPSRLITGTCRAMHACEMSFFWCAKMKQDIAMSIIASPIV